MESETRWDHEPRRAIIDMRLHLTMDVHKMGVQAR